MLSNHLILCHPLLLLPSIFPRIRVFFQWVGSSHQVAKVLELQLRHQSFSINIQAWFILGLTGLSSFLCKWFLSSITVQKHQFFSTQLRMSGLLNPKRPTRHCIFFLMKEVARRGSLSFILKGHPDTQLLNSWHFFQCDRPLNLCRVYLPPLGTWVSCQGLQDASHFWSPDTTGIIYLV